MKLKRGMKSKESDVVYPQRCAGLVLFQVEGPVGPARALGPRPMFRSLGLVASALLSGGPFPAILPPL